MKGLRFSWDAKKAEHRVSFQEALTVFADPLALIFADEEHSSDETREIIVGYTSKRRLVMVYFTERGQTLRIFSARRATRRERREYEEARSK
jgi:uncharacterized protein